MKKILILFLLVVFSSANVLAIDLSQLNLPKSIILDEPKDLNLPKNQAEKPVYVIFDNFVANDKNNEGAVISNLFELCYYDMYQMYPAPDYNYNSFMLRTTYSDAFFSQYKITDFDVAIFPLGEYPLNIATNGGIKVIDKINEMLDAGKRVMVIGRRMMMWAFYPAAELQAGKDPVVIDFLTTTLGMKKDSSGFLDMRMGNTWRPFHVTSIESNPTTKGYDMYCNVGYGRNVEPAFPFIFQNFVDVFQVNQVDGVTATTWIDQFLTINQEKHLEVTNEFPYGRFMTGLSAQIGDGKMTMWTYAPDVAAAPEMGFFLNYEKFSMNWFTIDLPKPIPWIEFETSLVDFGETLPESEKFKELRFRNFSTKPFDIQKIYTDGWTEEGIYTITEKPTLPYTMQPGEVAKVKIKFKPTDEEEYEDQLVFETTAQNGSVKAIILKGIGGKDAPTGPEITVQEEPFNFGIVDIGSAVIKDFTFESSGTAPLIVNKIEFTKNDDFVFNFPNTMNYPIVVQPGAVYAIQVRYSPREFGKTYNCTLKITSDAKVNPTSYIYGVGKTPSPSEGPIIEASIDTLDFGKVVPLHTITKNVDILNTGKQDLRINLIYFAENYDDAFSIPDEVIDNTPLVIKPYEKSTIPVSFKPYDDKTEYFADLGFFTNALNEGGDDYHIFFEGIGDVNGQSVSDNILYQMLTINTYPNPGTENVFIQINSQFTTKFVTVKLYNLDGKFLSNIFSGFLQQGPNNLPQLSNLQTGSYFISIEDGQNRLDYPFIIVK